MNHHQFRIKAEANIQFDHVRPIAHGPTKRRKGIFRRHTGTSAMGDHQH
jgi:hypothetical protein